MHSFQVSWLHEFSKAFVIRLTEELLGELAGGGGVESDELIVSESLASGIDSTDVGLRAESTSDASDSDESIFLRFSLCFCNRISWCNCFSCC